MRRQTSEERLYERVDGDRCGEDSYLRVRGQRDMGTLVEAVWTGGSLHSDIQLLWILLESESPAVGKFYKGSTAPALRLPGAHSSCKAEMTALTLDFWVSIPVPPPSSRVTLADFLFLPLCHGEDPTSPF